jgi:ABC-2 type transport system ATP-binding protein
VIATLDTASSPIPAPIPAPIDPDRAPVVIETHGLTRRFGSHVALDSLSIDVRRGEVLALLGPNGAGKTTTTRLLNGILIPDAGSSSVCGIDPASHGDDVRRRTAVVTENAGLDERLTVRENLTITARIRGMDRAVTARKVDELLERFTMSDRIDELVRGFSTGQRKRVALVRALLHDPEVLMLDEPTSGLDPEAIRDVLDLIATLAAEGRTILLCTHFLAEADHLADRVAILEQGHLLAFGSTVELAASLWSGSRLDIAVSAQDEATTRHAIGSVRGVTEVGTPQPNPDDAGQSVTLNVTIAERDVAPQVARAVVDAGVALLASIPRPARLEDVYFAVLSRAQR